MTRSFSRRVTSIILLILLSCIIWHAARSAVSQLYSYPAQDFLNAGEVNAVAAFESGYATQAIEHMNTSIAWQAYNQQLWVIAGSAAFKIGRLDVDNQQKHFRNASLAFRNAIKRDPANPLVWSKLLTVKAALNEFDDEFNIIFEKTLAYGTNDYRVIKLLVDIGFTEWKNLPVRARISHQKAVRIFYKNSPMELIKMAQKNNNLYMACLWVRDMNLIDGTCIKKLKEVP